MRIPRTPQAPSEHIATNYRPPVSADPKAAPVHAFVPCYHSDCNVCHMSKDGVPCGLPREAHVAGCVRCSEPKNYARYCKDHAEEIETAAYQRGLAEGARAEREACAKMAETPSGNFQVGLKAIPYWDGKKLAGAIRARSEEE